MRPWTFVSLVALSAATAALSAATTAPTFEAPRAGETIDVSIVNVDAVVVDREGNRVRGMTKDDFEIYENGKLQPLTNFAEYQNAGQAVVSEKPGEVIVRSQPRTIVVFIEHFRAPDFKTDPFFAGMREFLHRSVRPGDSVKIVTFGKKLETRLDFTDRLESIDRTLASIREESGPGIDEVTFEDRMFEEAFTPALNASRTASHWYDGNGNGHESMRSAIHYQTTSGPASAAGNFRFMRMRQKIASITALMNSIAGADSKKVFVMAVRRFNPSGYRDMTEIDSLAPSFGWKTTYRNDALVDYLAKTANANGITVYALHPEGLGREGFGTESKADFELLNSQLPYLREVAAQTGGRLAWGEEIAKELPKMADDLDAYYSLGYRAANHNVDRARSIVVKPKNRDYTIRSRREYVEKSDQTRMRERVIAGLFDQASAPSMNITVEVGKSRFVSNGRYRVPLTVYIPVASLMTDGGRGQFSVFVGWSGTGGEIGDVTKQSQKFTLTTGMPETFTYTFEVTADANTSRLSVGVFDEVSKDYGLKRIDIDSLGRVAGLR